MRNVLVTGGAGFIGSNLVRALVREPRVERVVVVDSLLTGHEKNLASVADKIEFFRIDIRDLASLEEVLGGIDMVFHQAAIPSVPRSLKEPELSHSVNVDGTFNVFLAAHRRGVRRVIYAASSSAYGDTKSLPKREEQYPRPKSPYAVQKLAGEFYARAFLDTCGLDTVSLRYFNVFGPHQDPLSPYSGTVSLFCNAALTERSPTIFGDGEQTRDFTYVDNVVQLNLLAAASPRAPGKTYNGGAGGRITLNQLWARLRHIAAIDVAPVYAPPRTGDILHSQADITAARRDLGYQPIVDLDEGLRRTLEWYRVNLQAEEEKSPEVTGVRASSPDGKPNRDRRWIETPSGMSPSPFRA